MRGDEVIEHLMEIKERLSVIETKLDVREDQEERLDAVEHKIGKAEASLKTLRWILGTMALTVPANVVAMVRLWKG